MARHPSSRRLPQAASDPDDAFIARVLELTAWSKANARAIIIVGSIVLVAVLGAIYYTQHRRAQEERATAELMTARQTAAAGNLALAVRDLGTLVNRFGSTQAGREARVLLARFLLEDGNYDGAAAAVGPIARDVDKPLGPAAAGLLAAAYEALEDFDAAVQVHLRVADRARFQYERRNALEAAAEIRLRQGRADEAVQLYERLLGTLPADFEERGIYEMRLAEARAQAGG